MSRGTLQWAITAMMHGDKVAHETFVGYDYLEYNRKEDSIVDDGGNLMEDDDLRHVDEYQTGWDIYSEPESGTFEADPEKAMETAYDTIVDHAGDFPKDMLTTMMTEISIVTNRIAIVPVIDNGTEVYYMSHGKAEKAIVRGFQYGTSSVGNTNGIDTGLKYLLEYRNKNHGPMESSNVFETEEDVTKHVFSTGV